MQTIHMCLEEREQSEKMMKKTELVFVPVAARGHIASTIEFAKRLLHTDDRVSITVLLAKLPGSTGSTDFVTDLATSNPTINFLPLPHVEQPPQELLKKSVEHFASVQMENHRSVVKETVVNHVLSKPNTRLGGLVVDLFCTSMIDVANELGVPAYVFFCSGAAFLGLMLYLPAGETPSDPDSDIPAYRNPVPARVLPSFAFNKDGGYTSMAEHGRRFRQAKGVIINTFAELEPHAIELLTAEELAVYTVGPVLNFEVEKHSDESLRIMKWLDGQPPSSVVLLCFGSGGGFEPLQLAEIATALERSGVRFLWCVRAIAPKYSKAANPAEYSSLDQVLPDGFLERTRNVGMVCSWAPQLAVLGHEAVGGFVSHCGWNSVLESIWNGVPIATWPIYAEQQANAFELVKELEIAVELSLDYRFLNADNVIMAGEIEKALRSLMDPGNPVRKRVKELREKSRQAVVEGGGSSVSLARFIQDVTTV